MEHLSGRLPSSTDPPAQALRSNPEMDLPGPRGPRARGSAGAAAAEKEELGLCGSGLVARRSFPGRYAAALDAADDEAGGTSAVKHGDHQ